MKFDALLIVSFGGPEGMADVKPFLENVIRGKKISDERLLEVVNQYKIFNGVSPINKYCRELKSLLEEKLDIPVYWGNRNWNPYIKDALEEMKTDGIKNALAYITSAYGSYSGCRQYLENIETARKEVTNAPSVARLPLFYQHPNFIQANVENIQEQLNTISYPERAKVHLVFTAHSIPISMSQTSPYVEQLKITCNLVAQKLDIASWKLVFQSRSGHPHTPWLEPDIGDYFKQISSEKKWVVVSPIGFVSDHMEVICDLDVLAKNISKDVGIQMLRAKTVGNHPLIIGMIVDMVKKGEVFCCTPGCCPSLTS